MGRSGMGSGAGAGGRSAGGNRGGGRSGGGMGRQTGGGASGNGRPTGAGKPAGGGARPAANRPTGGGTHPAAGRPAGGGHPAAGRPVGGAHPAGRPAPAPHGPARKRRRPFVRPMPFGLVSRFATDYVVCMAVLAALERLSQGYGTYEDEARCSDFFGRRLLPSEYYDCYLWMQEYMRECW